MIWSSTTLYQAEQRRQREAMFRNFIRRGVINLESAYAFHTNKYYNDDEGIQINRNEILKTVSITSIQVDSQIVMHYHDLIHQNRTEIALSP